MKKCILMIVSCILTVSLCLCNCSTTLAAYNKTHTKKVDGELETKVYNPKVYSVDLVWGDMKYIHRENIMRIWETKNYTYEDIVMESQWIPSDNRVKIVNHSNVGITVNYSYNSLEKYKEVEGNFSKADKLKLPSAVGKEYEDKRLKATNKLILSGHMDRSSKGYIKVGTIKLEIE
ncbi:MAG: hypothetical protein E7262_01905 [Lachnospiraceae bacterium]|nr:hypothetical protein [Lachnospiraceae bacterium]